MGSSFEDLEVWKKSCRLSVRLYKLLRDCRDYGMKDQMLRSSISIPSNIAEGSEKKSIPDFQRFINISDLDAKELIQELKTISKMLQSLHSSLKKL
jgi:four helix bundle protein